MKKLARKFLSMLLTAAIAVSGLVVTSVTAGAESIADKAIELEPMELVSRNFDEQGDSEYYSLNLPNPGSINILITKYQGIDLRLLDSNGVEVAFMNPNKGYIDTADMTNWSCSVENLEKGEYYLSVIANVKGNYIKNMSYSFSPAQKPTISFTATIKKGATLQLGSVTENYDGKVTWLSTKKSVATVSDKGLVTAKKAGTTYIRAQLDNGDYVEIKVIVKKK